MLPVNALFLVLRLEVRCEDVTANDEALRTVTTSLAGHAAILVAHEIGLYRLLGNGRMTAADVAAALGLRIRAAETLLDVSVASGFATREDGHYALSTVGADYLVESSPTYWGHYLDHIIRGGLFSYQSVRTGLLASDAGEVYQKQDIEDTKRFTRWMHSLSMAPALAWPAAIGVLDRHQHFLDIAGGSGAHAIGAALHCPELRATVLERPGPAQVAEEYITQYELGARVNVLVGDMWKDAFPRADVHFYSAIFHSWAPEKCVFLAKKSFEALEPGGRIMIHELFTNDDGSGPFRVVAVNVVLALLFSHARQYPPRELAAFLEQAGFVDVEIRPTFGDWGIVMGRRP